MNFLGFARSFFLRKNPFVALGAEFSSIIKDALTVRKKIKLAHYRLAYHSNQLWKMEKLIAENNEHSFLRGKKINEVR